MAREPGKNIDTWDMKDGDGNPVKVNIRMALRNGRTQFTATCKALPLLDAPWADSPDLLKPLLKEALTKIKTIEWSDAILLSCTSAKLEHAPTITVNKSDNWAAYDQIDGSLELKATFHEIGDRGEGKKCHRERRRHSWGRQDNRIGEGLPERYERDGELTQSILLDDTNANRGVVNAVMEVARDVALQLNKILADKTQVKSIAGGWPVTIRVTVKVPPAPKKKRRA